MTKLKFKNFYKQFWNVVKQEGSEQAKEFASESLVTLPSSVQWKVYLELAELEKRANRLDSARHWYREANRLEPFAPQAWIERAKMEEECGDLVTSQEIMKEGLQFCTHNEALLVKSIKHQERMGNLTGSRAVLASLQHVNVDKVWRTVLEGALMEARAGNPKTARRIFKYLMLHVSWYGPVFFEACRFEERNGEYTRALHIVQEGLREVPRYGPLWFAAFRLHARRSKEVGMAPLRQVLEKALSSISNELVWKVHFEAAGQEERAGDWAASRKQLVRSLNLCPKNLRWKAWLQGARMELRCGRTDVARLLLNRAMRVVPKKMRAVVLLECSRLEEFTGHTDAARAILKRAKSETRHEWKVFLEAVLLEARAGLLGKAVTEARQALKVHGATGRLWAVLIQLSLSHGIQQQFQVFREAVKEVPKSGEVWCEGARLCLNPCSEHFNLKAAKKFLRFAINFTPQYGDSFVEYLRLKLLIDAQGNTSALDRLRLMCTNADPNYGSMWFSCRAHWLETAEEVLSHAKTVVLHDLHTHKSLYHAAILRNWRNNKVEQQDDPHTRLLKQQRKLWSDRWRKDNINSLHVLYPRVAQLSAEDRHEVLFGSDPIP